MLNVKNFIAVEPTQEQKEKFTNPEGIIPQFLRSDDGRDWYECQALFADDTIKIMYDAKGVIRSIVDHPVPERGGILSVSVFFPLNMSVAELCGPVPDGFSIGGEWVFNGKDIVPRVYSHEELISYAEAKKAKLVSIASQTIAPLQDAVDLGIATDEEVAKLQLWKKYRVLLSRVILDEAPDIKWPMPPH